MTSTAIVARTCAGGMEYLQTLGGVGAWSPRINAAARFASVREATRAALRLPSRLRAYALPVCGDAALIAGSF